MGVKSGEGSRLGPGRGVKVRGGVKVVVKVVGQG